MLITISDVPALAWPESRVFGLANCNYIESPGLDLALAFQKYRPGQKPSQANLAGLAWPGLFWLGLAWLTASGQSRNITNNNVNSDF